MDPQQSVADALKGDRRAIARLISLVEDGGPELPEIMKALYPHTGRAYSIGITGAPGAGKSTLTERLIGRAGGDAARAVVAGRDERRDLAGAHHERAHLRYGGTQRWPDVAEVPSMRFDVGCVIL